MGMFHLPLKTLKIPLELYFLLSVWPRELGVKMTSYYEQAKF